MMQMNDIIVSIQARLLVQNMTAVIKSNIYRDEVMKGVVIFVHWQSIIVHIESCPHFYT